MIRQFKNAEYNVEVTQCYLHCVQGAWRYNSNLADDDSRFGATASNILLFTTYILLQ